MRQPGLWDWDRPEPQPTPQPAEDPLSDRLAAEPDAPRLKPLLVLGTPTERLLETCCVRCAHHAPRLQSLAHPGCELLREGIAGRDGPRWAELVARYGGGWEGKGAIRCRAFAPVDG